MTDNNQMDSLDKIIKDMEDFIDNLECHDWDINERVTPYLTRLKALREKKPGWFCSHCNVVVEPKDVTYEETHDIRSGGCGNNVTYKQQ
jgi:hypothetical protein